MVYTKASKFLARTVLVKNNDVEKSFQMLNRILSNEGIIMQARRAQRFEKHCDRRNRICYERCKRVYNEEMAMKMKFLIRKNRVDPYPR